MDNAAKVEALEAGLKAARAENNALKLQLEASTGELRRAADASETRALERTEGVEAQVAGRSKQTTPLSNPPLATENLLENTDGVLGVGAPYQRSLGAAACYFYLC